MYRWRRLTDAQRSGLLRHRQRLRRPWHRPPHFDQGTVHYHLVAACYEHRPHIGRAPDRMAEFSEALLDSLPENPAAWCVLPNHYHLLVRASAVKSLVQVLARLHGRSSHAWNQEEKTRGRKVWHGVSDRAMRSPEHFWATLNYIHHNPVHHGYVSGWTDWPFSSAADYLEDMGREHAARIWRMHPLLDYGRGWDDPHL